MFHSHSAMSRRRSLAMLVLPVVWLGMMAAGVGDDAVKKKEDEAHAAIDRMAKGYELFLGADRIPLDLKQEPVLRWPNSTRETDDGATFVWTRNGRPEAIACIWESGGILHHAFHSLSSSNLAAMRGGTTVWRPERAGLEMRAVPDAPEPADSAAKRHVQMKQLARRFSCRLAGEGPKVEELRLLPRPLVRYAAERKDLIDGALFAFVQGTDPEVILILEAARREANGEWRFALTRRSMLALEAELDGKRIWTVPQSAGAFGETWYQSGIAKAK